MPQSFTKKLEYAFERLIWKGRAVTLLAVIFSFISSVAMFLAGSQIIGKAVFKTLSGPAGDIAYNKLMIAVITGVDLYLIALVLLIFSFGVYELFISKIDIAWDDKEINILEVKTLDDLKNRLLKVIIMALVVHFFKVILSTPFQTPLEMLYLGLAILAVASSTYFIRKID